MIKKIPSPKSINKHHKLGMLLLVTSQFEGSREALIVSGSLPAGPPQNGIFLLVLCILADERFSRDMVSRCPPPGGINIIILDNIIWASRENPK